MPYKIAGIDVHKKMLAVVVSDVEVDGEYQSYKRGCQAKTLLPEPEARNFLNVSSPPARHFPFFAA